MKFKPRRLLSVAIPEGRVPHELVVYVEVGTENISENHSETVNLVAAQGY